MAAFLHLVGHNDPSRAVAVIAGQLAAGDAVTVAVVGPAALSWPPGSAVRRVPGDLTWAELLDLVLTADQTFSW
jgi:hypothetical protein